MNPLSTPVQRWRQVSPGEIVVELSTHTLVNKAANQLSIIAVTDAIIRVRHTVEAEFASRESLIVLPTETKGRLQVLEEENSLVLSTSEIRLEINRDTGAFTWFDKDGNLLTREPAEGGKTLEEITVNRTEWGTDTKFASEKTEDGEKTRASGGKQVFDRMAYSAKLRFEFSEDEAIFGLGQHEEGVLNYRGGTQHLYQHNLKVAMPVLVSSRGYGCLLDSTSLCIFRDNQYGSYLWTEVVPELDYYFILGPDFDRIVAGIRHLTGAPPLFPRWTYGYIQSKERYKSQQELLEVVGEYRRRELPLDCIVQDWCTWPEGQWGFKTFDAERFPDPRQLCEDLHAANTRLMVSLWPNMRGDANPDLEELREAGELLGDQSTLNVFSPCARDIYWRQAEQAYLQHGVDAWWSDATEPFKGDWQGTVKYEPEIRLQLNTAETKKFIDPGLLNAYSLEQSKCIYEGQRKTTDAKRVVNLNRSAYPGQQRYGTITWSGDIDANWKRLRNQIADGLNFTVTGNPRWTFDIGGFFVKPAPRWFRQSRYPDGCGDLGYRELYTRWFQFGAFLPMFRSHGMDAPREVWRFGEPGTQFYDTLVKFLHLRYRLLPYIYATAAREANEHYTLFRMLAFDFRSDPKALQVTDQFMFGPAFMVCPVTEPMYYESGSRPLEGVAKTREVYLPAGCDWVDFWTGERYEGGQTITADAPLETLPVYVRAGSIVPFGPAVQFADADPHGDWTLAVYPGADASFNVYEDEGDNYNYEKGAFAAFDLNWNDKEATLKVSERRGAFAGICPHRKLHLLRITPGAGYTGAESVPVVTIDYDGTETSRQLD
ncbi:MAG: DUF4968 domain-containing protein [Verrucomicrobia bacterium]|nr:DUF4968 domain-containing protein [Verrucomicrobiota bacterium]MCH8525545.1 DUF4968 domain-containing protein [Kiritimatiellia bacterium]